MGFHQNSIKNTGVLDAIMDLLRDGQPRTLNEISTHEPLRKLSITDLSDILNFLAEHDFIELSEKLSSIEEESVPIAEAKLTPRLQEFMREIRWIERAEGR